MPKIYVQIEDNTNHTYKIDQKLILHLTWYYTCIKKFEFRYIFTLVLNVFPKPQSKNIVHNNPEGGFLFSQYNLGNPFGVDVHSVLTTIDKIYGY